MTVQAIVRNGQLELESPLDLPDGTVLTIPVPEDAAEGNRSQRSIAEWERWYRDFQPIVMTDEERAAWDAARKEFRDWELSQWEEHSKKLEDLFP
jgi:hypothetical protein